MRPPPTGPAPARKGRLEFRIRPFATVEINGRILGQTPMAPLELPPGRYTVKLTNDTLSKQVLVPVEVKAGQSTLCKYNFLEK